MVMFSKTESDPYRTFGPATEQSAQRSSWFRLLIVN